MQEECADARLMYVCYVSGAPFRRVRQKWVVGPIGKMTTDISVVRGGWDPTLQQEIVDEYEYDGGNSSSRLFERSRIKALAGMHPLPPPLQPFRGLIASRNQQTSAQNNTAE